MDEKRGGLKKLLRERRYSRLQCTRSICTLMQVTRRVDRPAIADYLKMQVGTGGATCSSHARNFLSSANAVAFFDQYLGCVRVTCNEARLMCHLDHQTVAGFVCSPVHDTVACGVNRSTESGSDIHPFMHRLMARKGVHADTEAGRYPAAFDRPSRRRNSRIQFTIEQETFQCH